MDKENKIDLLDSTPDWARISADLEARITEKLYQYIVKIESRYSIQLPKISVSYDLRGTTAGRAYHYQNRIELNATALLNPKYTEDMINDTLPHELAHIAAYKIFGNKITAHGGEWREVMYALGIHPSRCHAYASEDIAIRKHRTYTYKCNCRTHKIKSKIHNRIQQGYVYICNKCKGKLELDI